MADVQELDTMAKRRPYWRRHPVLKWTLVSLLAVFVVLLAVVSVALHRAEPVLRAHIVAALEDHFHAHVELDSFHVSLADGLWAEGKGLRIWPPAEVQGVTVPQGSPGRPLISIEQFRFHAPLHYKPGEPIHVSAVQLTGLDIDVPPRSRFTRAPEHQDDAQQADSQQTGAPSSKPSGMQALLRVEIGSIACTRAQLTLETSKPGKLPLQFEIASLKLTDISAGKTMKFTAELTNARPVGLIHTSGTFGPWSVDDPGESQLAGQYKFDNANLGDFRGIAGTLNSTGNYKGTLRDLTVDGVTDTPDFRLIDFGTPLPLHAQFHATVDATNGDTWLDPVQATLGKSSFTVKGQVVRIPQDPAAAAAHGTTPQRIKGHDISLKVDVEQGRMEDFMRLTSKSGTPLLTGAIHVKADLEIPPGVEKVHRRMKLKGVFTVDDAQFTDAKVQDKIAELSLRGQGQPKQAKNNDAADQVRSTMQSDFQMAGGVITLPDLKYSVPGADIDLAGTYTLDGGGLDFKGTARMQATVSQMVGGWKGLLLKPADRFFKKDGAGTEVPIHIDGTREHPGFGVDVGHMKLTSPQRPDQKQDQQETHPQSPAQSPPPPAAQQ
jgi:hypothetical protein